MSAWPKRGVCSTKAKANPTLQQRWLGALTSCWWPWRESRALNFEVQGVICYCGLEHTTVASACVMCCERKLLFAPADLATTSTKRSGVTQQARVAVALEPQQICFYITPTTRAICLDAKQQPYKLQSIISLWGRQAQIAHILQFVVFLGYISILISITQQLKVHSNIPKKQKVIGQNNLSLFPTHTNTYTGFSGLLPFKNFCQNFKEC